METDPGQILARLAHQQHGVVTRRQLLAAGWHERSFQRQLEHHRLIRVHRGVYAVGHRRLRREGLWLAAVLAMGRGALLSHRDAAALHGIRWPHDGVTDVVAPARRTAQRGIRAHRSRTLQPRDATVRDGVPVTSVARTLVDLAGAIPRHQLHKAVGEAERQGLFDLWQVSDAMKRIEGRVGGGHKDLRRVLDLHASHGAQLTRSDLEDRMLALADDAGLPHPRMNAWIEGVEVDAHWPQARLVVELDSWAFHRTRAAFEQDHAKTLALTDAGYVVLRFTHRQLERDPAAIARSVRRVIVGPTTQPRSRESPAARTA